MWHVCCNVVANLLVVHWCKTIIIAIVVWYSQVGVHNTYFHFLLYLLLSAQRGGFYVECGAFDGERSSNTIHLERQRGWTGLLVEMDPYFYTQLIGKSRRSWSINACLSPEPYLTQVQLTTTEPQHVTRCILLSEWFEQIDKIVWSRHFL